jgi:type II secretory ATPase GspE/PulE/Tfp pilus assembly ATPase PilB-like protein
MEQLMRRVRGASALMDAEKLHGDTTSNIYEKVTEPDLRGVFVENLEGCKHCYRGRTGRTVAAEVVEADSKIMTMLENHQTEDARRYWLSPHGLDGMTMAQHALRKVMRGEVSPIDAEFEMGLLIRDKELAEVEKVLGTFVAPQAKKMSAPSQFDVGAE